MRVCGSEFDVDIVWTVVTILVRMASFRREA
jgi:hypothetical protein